MVASVKIALFLGMILLSLTTVLAYDMKADIVLGSNNIVVENFNINFFSNQSYNSVKYTTTTKPLSVQYDGSYIIVPDNGSYSIFFDKNISSGDNNLRFILVYNNLVEESGKLRVFREGFAFPVDEMYINLTLPEHYILSTEPSATPSPNSVSSNGKNIILAWQFDMPDAAIAVFYEGQSANSWIYIILVLILIIAVIIMGLFFKRKMRNVVTDTLSDDEKKVVELVREGITKQKSIALKLGFSKSKMSKVLRKLEEKNLIEKTPYFKTNIIKLKKIK